MIWLPKIGADMAKSMTRPDTDYRTEQSAAAEAAETKPSAYKPGVSKTQVNTADLPATRRRERGPGVTSHPGLTIGGAMHNM